MCLWVFESEHMPGTWQQTGRRRSHKRVGKRGKSPRPRRVPHLLDGTVRTRSRSVSVRTRFPDRRWRCTPCLRISNAPVPSFHPCRNSKTSPGHSVKSSGSALRKPLRHRRMIGPHRKHFGPSQLPRHRISCKRPSPRHHNRSRKLPPQMSQRPTPFRTGPRPTVSTCSSS